MSKENMWKAMVATKQLEIDKLKRILKEKETPSHTGFFPAPSKGMVSRVWVTINFTKVWKHFINNSFINWGRCLIIEVNVINIIHIFIFSYLV